MEMQSKTKINGLYNPQRDTQGLRLCRLLGRTTKQAGVHNTNRSKSDMRTTTARLDRLTAEALAFIRRAEPLALKMDARGIHVAFSGGKDSQVLLALVEMAGVKHHAEMQLTSVDPPQVMRFVRENYPQVHLNRPRTTMYKLITRKHILPTRKIRFCCSEFKEFAGRGSVTATGIRRTESARRAKRKNVEMGGREYGIQYGIQAGELVELDENTFFSAERKETVHCVGNKDKVIINPILDWTEADVWGFLDYHKMPHCSLYDMGYKRIGCIFCPMQSEASKNKDLLNFPRFIDKVYLRAIRTLRAQGYFTDFCDEYEVIDWWHSNMNKEDYLKENRT